MPIPRFTLLFQSMKCYLDALPGLLLVDGRVTKLHLASPLYQGETS